MPKTIDIAVMKEGIDRELGSTKPRKMRKSLLYIQYALKITKMEMAQILGVSYYTMLWWMNGNTTPNEENQSRIKEWVKRIREERGE